MKTNHLVFMLLVDSIAGCGGGGVDESAAQGGNGGMNEGGLGASAQASGGETNEAGGGGSETAGTGGSDTGGMGGSGTAGAGGSGTAGAGGSGTAGAGGSPGGANGTVVDTARFNFENGKQGWVDWGDQVGNVGPNQPVVSKDKAWAGNSSLAYVVETRTRQKYLGVAGAVGPVKAGKTIKFHYWIPKQPQPKDENGNTVIDPSVITAVSAFIMGDSPDLPWYSTGDWWVDGKLPGGQWNTITLTVPAFYAGKETHALFLGLQFALKLAPYKNTVYVDSIEVER